MSINIRDEPPITLTDATAYIPRRRKGRRTSASTLYRWAAVGVRGVKLETIQVGGSKCTSLEALQRFFDRLSGCSCSTATVEQAERTRSERVARADRIMTERWHRSGERRRVRDPPA